MRQPSEGVGKFCIDVCDGVIDMDVRGMRFLVVDGFHGTFLVVRSAGRHGRYGS